MDRVLVSEWKNLVLLATSLLAPILNDDSLYRMILPQSITECQTRKEAHKSARLADMFARCAHTLFCWISCCCASLNELGCKAVLPLGRAPS